LAVPGEITSGLSAGTNALIRQGAAPLLSVDDVLDEVGLERTQAPDPGLGGHAGAVLAALQAGAIDVDGLACATGLTVAEVAAALVELELAGLASAADGLYRAAL
jgi:DNA processing protein